MKNLGAEVVIILVLQWPNSGNNIANV